MNIFSTFVSTSSQSSFPLLLPFILFVFSLFIFFRRRYQGRRHVDVSSSTTSRRNATQYVDAAIERALKMRSIVSRMPSDNPRIPERDSDYHMKRAIVLDNQ